MSSAQGLLSDMQQSKSQCQVADTLMQMPCITSRIMCPCMLCTHTGCRLLHGACRVLRSQAHRVSSGGSSAGGGPHAAEYEAKVGTPDQNMIDCVIVLLDQLGLCWRRPCARWTACSRTCDQGQGMPQIVIDGLIVLVTV